jgi:hypothetical protein
MKLNVDVEFPLEKNHESETLVLTTHLTYN